MQCRGVQLQLRLHCRQCAVSPCDAVCQLQLLQHAQRHRATKLQSMQAVWAYAAGAAALSVFDGCGCKLRVACVPVDASLCDAQLLPVQPDSLMCCSGQLVVM
jgi:hypothetical protein